MLDDWVDRVRDVTRGADTNDWIAAVIIGLAVQFVVLILFRVLGFFFRMATWFVASLVGVAVALYILDRNGSVAGARVDRWIDDLRDYIGV